MKQTLHLTRALLALTAVATLTVSCHMGGGVRITSTNFEEVVEPTQNLVFTFNEALVGDDQIGRWDTTAYLKITPAVAGRFQWTSPTDLVFSPVAGFGASTNYTAEPSEAVLMHVKAKRLSLGSREAIKFHTPYLDFSSAEGIWTLGANGQPAASVRVSFNYPVDAKELASRLSTRVNDTEIKATLRSTGTSATHTLDLAPYAGGEATPEVITYTFEVKPGLPCAVSDYATTETLRYQLSFASKPTLSVSNVETEPGSPEGQVRVTTTQAVPTNGLARHIRFEPAVEFRAEATDYGFRLLGAFDQNTTYTLTISENLVGILGTRLGQPYQQAITFGATGKVVQFQNERGELLSAAGARNLGVRILGVDKVQVRFYKVYENNLLAFFRQGRNWGGGGYDSATDEYYSYDRYETEAYGDLLWEKEYETRSLPLQSGVRLLNLPPDERRQDFKGIYVVEVVSKEQFWVRATKLLALSEVGLMARTSEDEILAFAHGLLDAQPLGGVNLTLWSSNNQPIANATTDGSGIARFEKVAESAPGFRWAMLTATRPGSGGAQRADDFSYLMLDRSVETSRYDVSGKVTQGRTYDAYLYGDRDIYRPGDTLRYNAIVRSLDWQTVAEMPVKLKVLMPGGRELTALRGTLNAQGAWQGSVGIPAAAMTGSYTLELYSGGDELLGSRTVSVEEFLPDRIKVTATLSAERITPGQSVRLSGQALNLYGPPATGRSYEAFLNLERTTFSAEGYEDYSFGLSGSQYFEPVNRSGTTDAQGQVSESFGPFDDIEDVGLLSGRVLLTVLDETNRPVGRSATFELSTQPVYYGLKSFDRYQPLRQPMTLALAALTAEGKPAQNASAHVMVVRKHWDVVLERSYNTYRYRSIAREQVVMDRIIGIPKPGTTFQFTATQWGEYEVRVFKPGAKAYVSQEFYSYGWDGGQAATYEADPEGRVIIEANKDAYAVGDKAELLFKTPFDGRLIVTVERDRVYEHHVLSTENNSATLRLGLSEAHLPNVYVSATLIRGLRGPQLPLTVAHGYRSLKVEAADRKLEVAIEAPEKSTSRRSQTLTVITEPGAEVTLAAVDEGILQIMNSASPNPYAYFYAKRALEVAGHDVYGRLLPELSLTKSSSGGDAMMAELGDRANPMTNKRVKLVTFWSGHLRADGSGRASFTVNLPAFSGQLRLMAAAYKGRAFGAAAKPMIVADPVVISSGLPRFLSPGDTVIVPVTLANTTAQSLKASATLKTTGPLRVLGAAAGSVTLAANGEGKLSFTLAANADIGEGSAEVTVSTPAGTFAEKVELTVRPAAGFTPLTGAGRVAAGQTAQVDLTLPGLLPASRRARLIVSRSPAVELGRDLSYLLGYPHGCVEQTVSKAFPQLYFTELSRTLSAFGPGMPNTSAYNVREAVAKLQSMQRADGGMSFWAGGGDDESYPWGSVYAAHFLHEAQRAGYDVSAAVQQRLDDYLIRLSSTHTTEKTWFGDGTQVYLTPRHIPYSLYVLALRGKPQLARMNFYKSRPDALTSDSRYLVSAAYALSGDPAGATYVLPQALGKASRAESGGSLSSPIRDRALALLMLLEVNPQHNQAPELARELSRQLKDARWLSTQEAAFGFLALGKLSRSSESAGATGSARADGKALGELPSKGDLTLTSGLAGKRVEIAAQGGPLYYFWQGVGIGTGETVTEEDNGIRVRRTTYSRSGNRLDGSTFVQNDLAVITLSVELTGIDELENVVITDLLPAGLEIENPRIREVPGLNWLKSDAPTHSDFRDDRVNFYTTLRAGKTYTFAYVVRAVGQGSYRRGPATADAMYRPEYRSTHGAGQVRVLAPTDGN